MSENYGDKEKHVYYDVYIYIYHDPSYFSSFNSHTLETDPPFSDRSRGSTRIPGVMRKKHSCIKSYSVRLWFYKHSGIVHHSWRYFLRQVFGRVPAL